MTTTPAYSFPDVIKPKHLAREGRRFGEAIAAAVLVDLADPHADHATIADEACGHMLTGVNYLLMNGRRNDDVITFSVGAYETFALRVAAYPAVVAAVTKQGGS